MRSPGTKNSLFKLWEFFYVMRKANFSQIWNYRECELYHVHCQYLLLGG